MSVIALDVETLPIAVGRLNPRVICCSFAAVALWSRRVVGNSWEEDLEGTLREILAGEVVGHNVAFDMACISFTYPRLSPLIWKAYAERRVHDTLVREKLVHLGTHGSIDALAGRQVNYSLLGVAKDRLGVDLHEDKASSIRIRYHELDRTPTRLYPRDFYDYSQQDADITLRIYLSQESVGEAKGFFASEWLHVNMAWCLYFSTVRGIKVDKDMVLDLWDETKEAIDLENFPLLRSSGIIVPACPGRAYKSNPFKFTKPKPEKVSVSKALIPRIEEVCKEHGLKIELTETGRVSANKQVIADLAPLDPVLGEYQQRQSLAKLVNTYFPALAWPPGQEEGEVRLIADVIHPQYDSLKKTGRISSWGNSSRSKKIPLYPSVNIQQVDPRVRGCYVPREGYWLLSADYAALELCCLADTVYKLYGRSKLREQLNNGMDPYAWFGGCVVAGNGDTYDAFLRKKIDEPGYFKHWRTLAKPVKLGYPGGMGVHTMIKACAGYGVKITEDEAWRLKGLWLKAYPVMEDYLWYEGDEERTYVSAHGMVRAGCNYTQYCNGKALQTPGAEGMKIATFDLCREIYDEGSKEGDGSLAGCHFLASIHDEVLLEVPKDEASACAERVAEIMVKGMRGVLTSMNEKAVRVETSLMKRWSKKAEPVYANGELIPWEE